MNLPDMASLAMDRCVNHVDGSDRDPTKGAVDLNHEFIDDTYTDYLKLVIRKARRKPDNTDPCKWNTERYTSDVAYLKQNHPLSILVIIKYFELSVLFESSHGNILILFCYLY